MPLTSQVYSGRFGAINGCSQVTQWSLTTTLTDNAHSNSYTKAGKMRDEGVKDWTGSCTILGNKFPGNFNWNQATQIDLYTGGATYGGTGKHFSGQAIWNSITLSGDISSGNRVQCQVSFQGSGALTAADGAYADTITPNIWMSKDCEISFGNSTIEWKSFNFSINNESQELLDSSCFDDESEDVWKKRYPGIIDCTGTIDWVGDTEPASMNDIEELTIACKGTTVLQMGFARYMGMGSYTVDPSSGALVGGSSSFNMCAHDDEGTMGSLTVLGINLFPPQASSGT